MTIDINELIANAPVAGAFLYMVWQYGNVTKALKDVAVELAKLTVLLEQQNKK